MSASLAQWIDAELRHATVQMFRSVSAMELVKDRPGFGTSIRAGKGSVIASPVLASYDPDPDYFFHWFRDSAVVLEALRILYLDGSAGPEALLHLHDFVKFSLGLRTADGRALVASPGWRKNVAPDFVKFLRDDADLLQVHGDAVSAETRVNPDGSLDISKWARPQHDGPPLRALALLRWIRQVKLEGDLAADVATQIRADLGFTYRLWRTPSFDIWEEENGHHYYTLRMSAAALHEGAAWLASMGEGTEATQLGAEGDAVLAHLDGFWLEDHGYYRSRVMPGGVRSEKELDIAVILSAIHSEGDGPAHSVRDPRMHATLAALEAAFERLYAINHARPDGQGIAMGRYEGDIYYSGGAYFFSTLGAAEYCYRASRSAEGDAAKTWYARGDAFLTTARAFATPEGDLSEQFDQHDGHQTSARHLAWSYAGLISTVAARRAAAAAHGLAAG